MDRRTQNPAGSDGGAPGGDSPPIQAQQESDQALIENYTAGRTEAFSTVDDWIGAVLRRTYASLRHEHEDISQMVHTKLLASLKSGRFQARSALRTYVSGIAHHTAIDRLRLLYRDRALAETVTGESRTALGNPYRTLEAANEREQVVQVLHALPKACLNLWHMVFVEKLSYEVIAGQLSIPAGTVKSRMWHCRRKAQAALDRFRRLVDGVRPNGVSPRAFATDGGGRSSRPGSRTGS